MVQKQNWEISWKFAIFWHTCCQYCQLGFSSKIEVPQLGFAWNLHSSTWLKPENSSSKSSLLFLIFFLQVAQQCKENIYAIQTLKDFQYLDDNKDQGINVREKAKSLVALLKDDERLRNERVRALKAKERFAQSAAGIGSDTVVSIFLAP